MMLPVLGLGLVSSAGASAREHVFFPRAEGPPPQPSPFLGLDGRRIDARYCPWIDGFDACAPRLRRLAVAAIDEALAPLPADAVGKIPLFSIMPAPRPGLTEADLGELTRALGDHARTPQVSRGTGAAFAFAALAQIAALVEGARIPGALLVGVDSLIGLGAMVDRAQRPESPFLPTRLPPGEGAGAILLAGEELARRSGAILGTINASAIAKGRATDDNDEAVDAAPMTALLRHLPGSEPIHAAFGQGRVGLLRQREWEWSVARTAHRFSSTYFGPCLEAEIGEVGAAAGVMNLAFSLASFRHGAVPPEAAAPRPFVAWAISRDGTRGIALGAAAPPDPTALAPLDGAARARHVERSLFAALEEVEAELDEEPGDEEMQIDAALAGDELGVANDVAPLLPALPVAIAPPPPVALDVDRASRVALPDFRAGMIAHALELAAALGRARVEGPWRGLADTDARLLRQLDAIVAAGPRALLDVASFWEARIDDAWACFAGALASAAFAGDDAMALIAHAVHLVPPDAADHAVTIAEALALSDHQGLAALARALSASPHPVARAAGTSLRSARGELPLDAILAALPERDDLVTRAGIWAAERLPPAERDACIAPLRALTQSASPAVAWSAARVLVIWGDRALLLDATEGALAQRLGARAMEAFVLGREPEAWPLFEALLARERPTRATISAVARFGSADAAPWLLQRLGDDVLGGAAAAALGTIFGPLVAPADEGSPGAWRAAIAARKLSASTRWRRGEPWSPSSVADECASGDLPRRELELRVDELRARLVHCDVVDVTGWHQPAQAALAGLLGRARTRI